MTLARLSVAAFRMFFSDFRVMRLEAVVLRPSGLLEISMSRIDMAVSLKVISWLGVRFWARSRQSLEPAITATTVCSCASFRAEMIILSKRLYVAPPISA